MGVLKEIRQKAIDLVAKAKARARKRFGDRRFDQLGFSDDLDLEFDQDPRSFAEKYKRHLTTLTAKEIDAIRNG